MEQKFIYSWLLSISILVFGVCVWCLVIVVGHTLWDDMGPREISRDSNRLNEVRFAWGVAS